MRSVVVLALALSAGAVQAQMISVLSLNAGQTDVGVEGKDKAETAEVLPNQAMTVSLTRHQWLRLGQEAYRYDLRPIFSLKRNEVWCFRSVRTESCISCKRILMRRARAPLVNQQASRYPLRAK